MVQRREVLTYEAVGLTAKDLKRVGAGRGYCRFHRPGLLLAEDEHEEFRLSVRSFHGDISPWVESPLNLGPAGAPVHICQMLPQ